MELPDGAALVLTVATYASPNGKKIIEEAVTPGTVVGKTPEEEANEAEDTAPAKTDLQLNKALDLLKAKAA